MKEQCWVVIYRSLSDLSKTLPNLRGGQSQTSLDISRDEPNVAGSERRRARSLPDLGRNDLSFKCLPLSQMTQVLEEEIYHSTRWNLLKA